MAKATSLPSRRLRTACCWALQQGHSFATTSQKAQQQARTSRRCVCPPLTAFTLSHTSPPSGHTEVELTKPGSGTAGVHSIFCDPGARHAVVVLRDEASGRPAETVYFHATWRKARPLTRVRGVWPTSMAWRPDCGDAVSKEVLVGTANGTIAELQLDSGDSKRPDVSFKQLLELPNREAVTGVLMELAPASGAGPSAKRAVALVVVATATRLFCCTAGGASLEAALSGGLGNPVVDTTASQQTAGGGGSSSVGMLHVTPTRFAWLTRSGVFTGTAASLAARTPAAAASERTRLAFPGAGGQEVPASSAMCPLCVCATQFHVLMLYPDKLSAVNVLSGKPAATVHLQRYGVVVGGGSISASSALALSHDIQGGAIYLSTSEGLHEVVLKDEARDQWRLHLSRREYAAALACASDGTAKERVHYAAGEAAWAAGDATAAALAFAKAPSRVRFEDITLRLLASRDAQALRAYLRARLDALPKGERAAATLLATWLLELYLHALAAERDATSPQPSAPTTAAAPGGAGASNVISPLSIQFRTFLKAHAAHLDTATSVRLLSDFGRTDELVFFADLRGDASTVVTHHLAKGDAAAAIAVLRRPGMPPELHYTAAPRLFALAPQAAVDLWLTAADMRDAATGQPVVDPARLVPALAAARGGALGEVARAQAVRYLEHSASLGCAAPGVHNLLLTLHAEGSGPGAESALLRYLRAAGGNAKLYDPAFALRVCTSVGAYRAVVELHVACGAHDLAVDAALRAGDVALAQRVVDDLPPGSDDPGEQDAPGEAAQGLGGSPVPAHGLRKALWLRIAAHVLGAAGAHGGDAAAAVTAAVQLVAHTDGVLALEDVLPLCPDSSSIDAFRDAMMAALDAHAATVTSLRTDMADAASAADALSAAVASLETRSLAIPRNAVCSRCGTLVAHVPHPPGGAHAAGVPSFHVFPCGHCFCAGTCLLEAHAPGLGPSATQRARHAWAALVDGRHTAGPEVARNAYETPLCAECPMCGEAAVRAVTLPFVDPATEGALMASWEV